MLFTRRGSIVHGFRDDMMRAFGLFAAVLGLASCVNRLNASDVESLAPVVQLLGETDDAALQRDVLIGMREGLRGRKRMPMPEGWPAAYARLSKSNDAEVREHALALA